MLRKTIAAAVVALALVLVPAPAHADDATVVLDQPGGGTQVGPLSVLERGDDPNLVPYLGVCLGLAVFGLTLGFLIHGRLVANREAEITTGVVRGRRTRGEFWGLTAPPPEPQPPGASENGPTRHQGLVRTP